MSKPDRDGSIAHSPLGPGSGSPGGLGRRNRQTSTIKMMALRGSDFRKLASIILREVCRVQDGRASNLVLEECNLYPRGEQ